MGVIGVQLGAHLLAVGLGLVVHVLVAAEPANRRHGQHPEVTGVAAEDVQRVAEAEFDLEPVAVENNDVERIQSDVGGMSMREPRSGWCTRTKRTSRPTGRQSRSTQRYELVTSGSP